jgi:hypothetical protein
MKNKLNEKKLRHFAWAIFIITFASLSLNCARPSGADLIFRLSDYNDSPIRFLLYDSSDVLGITSSLAMAVKDKDAKSLKKLVEKHNFLPAGMTREEYVDRVLQTEKTVVIKSDSIRIVFLHEDRQLATIQAAVLGEDSSGQSTSSHEEEPTQQAFQVKVVESEPSWAGTPIPTHAIVYVSVLSRNRNAVDTEPISNSIFFKKEGKSWIITSFDKDLLELTKI